MPNLPFPLQAGEQLYHVANAAVWHNDDKLFTPYTVYLTTHRILGVNKEGRIAFSHFFQRVGSVEVDRGFWRDPGLRVELRDGTSLHLALRDDRQQDLKATATRWANLIHGHMLNLGG